MTCFGNVRPRVAMVVCCSPASTAAARSAPSRRSIAAKVPAPGKPPVLRVPTWTRATLANGAELVVSEKHDLPLVSFTITFMGGADQFEKADRRGVASLAAAMLSEGTKTRDGEALSNALQLLGGNVSTSVGRRVRLDRLRLDRGQVPADARHPRRHDAQLDLPGRRADAAEGAAAGGVDPGAGPARLDRRPRLPAGPLRREPPVRSDR